VHLRAEEGKILLLEVRGYIIVATAEVTHDERSLSYVDVFVNSGFSCVEEGKEKEVLGKKADL
jgi:hypothetical protein